MILINQVTMRGLMKPQDELSVGQQAIRLNSDDLFHILPLSRWRLDSVRVLDINSGTQEELIEFGKILFRLNVGSVLN